VLEWMDPHELLPVGETWMAQEALRILDGADIGARWEWRRQREPGSASVVAREHRLRVVLVPSEPSGPGWRLLPNTLGATIIDNDGGEAPPAVYIFYNAVAASLGIGERADHRALARAWRALGRVVAHEVAHAIVPREPHASDGLMRARLESRFLTAKGDVSIDARWKNALGIGMSELCSGR
jgi:hypothetical protein